MGDEAHFFRDYALAGIMHLGEIAGGILALALLNPLCAGIRDAVSIAAVAIRAIRGRHGEACLVPENLIIVRLNRERGSEIRLLLVAHGVMEA
jgi:hypothetical protein